MQRSFQVKMQGKQLENEAKKCMTEATKHRNKAKAELRKGNRAAAQMYAQSAMRFEQQANQLLQQAGATTSYAIDMRAAETTSQMAHTMALATTQMTETSKKINLDKVSANRSKLNTLKEKMGAAHDLLTVGEDDMEINAGAEDLLAALERENDEYAMAQISEIPQGIPDMNAYTQSQYGALGK